MTFVSTVQSQSLMILGWYLPFARGNLHCTNLKIDMFMVCSELLAL